MNAFEQELAGLLNKHNYDQRCETPDFVLARYVDMCLKAYENATHVRDTLCNHKQTWEIKDNK